MTNHYELLYLIPASQTEEDLTPIKEKVKNLLTKFEAKMTLEDSLGKRKLAYPIKNARYGYYLLYEFDLEGENLIKLNRELRLLPGLLRHQIVKRSLKAPRIIPRPEKEIADTKITKDQRNFRSKPTAEKTDDKNKIKLEDLDDKLDELLEGDIKMA